MHFFEKLHRDYLGGKINEDQVDDALATPLRRFQFAEWLKASVQGWGPGKARIPGDPASFAEKYSQDTRTPWVRAKHLDLISDRLVDLYNGKSKRHIFAIPPRHGKSLLISYYFPLWLLANNPRMRIVIAAYNHNLAEEFGRRLRDFVRDRGSEIGLELDSSTTAADRWSLKTGGSVTSVGRGGALTGKGADCLLIDDPLKDELEASSQLIRDRLFDWWATTASTRLEPGGFVCLVQTRWSVDDLAGRLLRQAESGEGPKWDLFSLPAIAEEAGDVLGRQPGEALWPARYPIEVLLEQKRGMPAYHWSALYQQNPIPSEGGMFPFSWWQYYDVLPAKFDVMIQSWDFSFKDAKRSDFVVGQVWGRLGSRFYLVDQVRDRMSAKDSMEAIRAFSAKYPQARAKLFEDKANGPALKSLLHNEIGGIIPINPRGNKAARASAVSPFVQAGNVLLPTPAKCPWVNDFVLEFGAFPNGANDDSVDAMSMALNYLAPGGYAQFNSLYREASSMNSERKSPVEAHQEQVWRSMRKAVKEQERARNGVYKRKINY